jgi:radical SAM superfamily enzyme YgiQ (UPF0313 family)
VAEEALFLRRELQEEHIFFVDDTVNLPPDYAHALAEALIAAGAPVRWYGFASPAGFDGALAEAFARSGCAGLEFGTDSGSPTMLEALCKGFGQDEVHAAATACREAGIPQAHYIVFGGPGETEETVRESFRLMDAIRPTAVIAMTGIRIYPGTPLEGLARDRGVIEVGDDLLWPRFYVEPALRDTLLGLVQQEALARTGWVAPGLELNISARMMEQLRRMGHRGPLWQLVPRMGKSRLRPLQGEGSNALS